MSSTSSINTLLLNCILTATEIAIAKGYLALELLGNPQEVQSTDTTTTSTTTIGTYQSGLIYDYQYPSLSMIHYIHQ